MNEFQFLDYIREKYALGKVGDDCAVLPQGPETDLLITADMLVEDVDFRLEWAVPELLGHKALAVSLSDIAAMGGSPTWAMISIGIPDELWAKGFLERFYEGYFDLASSHGVELVGGDISRMPKYLAVDSVVGGQVTRGNAILRSTAASGDAIFLSGSIGGAAGGLRLLENGLRYERNESEPHRRLLLKQLRPQPELLTANSLQQLGLVTAMIDVSDGLSSDLGHICHSSRKGAVIEADLLPIDPDLYENFSPNECLQFALNGGEDYRLLFTAPSKAIATLTGMGAVRIGEITSEIGRIDLVEGGNSRPIDPAGYQHFS